MTTSLFDDGANGGAGRGEALPDYILHMAHGKISDEQDYHVIYPTQRPLGIVLSQVGQWAIVKWAPAESDVEPGSVLTAVNHKHVLLERYKLAMREIVQATWPLQLSFRRAPHAQGVLKKRPRSASNKQWRPRWFELKQGVLRYYSKEGGELKGVFELEDARVHWLKVEEGERQGILLTRPGDQLCVQPKLHSELTEWAWKLYYAVILANGGAGDDDLLGLEQRRYAELQTQREAAMSPIPLDNDDGDDAGTDDGGSGDGNNGKGGSSDVGDDTHREQRDEQTHREQEDVCTAEPVQSDGERQQSRVALQPASEPPVELAAANDIETLHDAKGRKYFVHRASRRSSWNRARLVEGLAADGVGLSEGVGVSANSGTAQHALGTIPQKGADEDTRDGSISTNTSAVPTEPERENEELSADGGKIMELVDPTSNHAYYLDTKTRRTSWVRSDLLTPAPSAECIPVSTQASSQMPAKEPAQASMQVATRAPTHSQEPAQVQERVEAARAEWYKEQQARLDAAVLDGVVRSHTHPGMVVSQTQRSAAPPNQVEAAIEERVEPSSGRHYFVHLPSGRSAWTKAELATQEARPSNVAFPSDTTTASAVSVMSTAPEAVGAAVKDTEALGSASNMPDKQQVSQHEMFDWDERASFIRRVLSIRVERVRIAQEESAAAAAAVTRSHAQVQAQPQLGTAAVAVADGAGSTAVGTAGDGHIESHFDPRTGRRYYFDKRSRRSSWTVADLLRDSTVQPPSDVQRQYSDHWPGQQQGHLNSGGSKSGYVF